jgi:hypothetical protein
MSSVPYFCDDDSLDEFDEAWERSFLDYEARVSDDKDEKDDKEFEKKPLTRECKCCTMR